MRYSSVGSTTTEVPNLLRRLGDFDESKWRLPEWLRMTLPVAVILNRFATAFRVFIPLGRRIQ